MNLKQLIENCDVKKVCEVWEKEYNNDLQNPHPSTSIPKYIESLKETELTLSPEWCIVIELIEPEMLSEGDEPWVKVTSKKVNDPQSWAMELSSNSEWLGFEIVNKLGDVSNEILIAHIIWEMSWYGWTDEQRKEQTEKW